MTEEPGLLVQKLRWDEEPSVTQYNALVRALIAEREVKAILRNQLADITAEWDRCAALDEQHNAALAAKLAARTTERDEALRSASHLGETADRLIAQLTAMTAERDRCAAIDEQQRLALVDDNATLAGQLTASEAARGRMREALQKLLGSLLDEHLDGILYSAVLQAREVLAEAERDDALWEIERIGRLAGSSYEYPTMEIARMCERALAGSKRIKEDE